VSLKAAAGKRRTRVSKGKSSALADVTEEPLVRLNVNLPASLHREFKMTAYRQRIGMSTLVAEWVKRYVKQHAKDNE
jgi:predicted HicB family RNase H-like nuclease